MTFLGIDLGTSGLRALLMDADGTALRSTEQHYSVKNPHPGWSEQDPRHWIDALEAAIAEMREIEPAFADLAGIGVAGHMHGATLLDAQGGVLRDCILWNDTRAHAEAAELDGTRNVRNLSGNIVFPGFTAPKLSWVRTHEPEIFAKVDKVLLPAAFLNHYLTGTFVADMSDSAGTSWLDTGARDWSEDLLKAGHMRRDQMPSLAEGSAAAGTLRTDLATKWGLKGDVTIAGGAGDNAAAACGIGALTEGQGFVSLGTSGVLLAARDGYAPAPETALHTFCHAVPDTWYQMGVMLSATDCLNWLSGITGQTPAELTAGLGATLSAPGEVQFLPYLSGERTPHNDAQIRGAFTGLATTSTRETLTHAVLAGVTFGLRDSFDALRNTGAQLDHLMAIGGGARSRYWVEMIATVLGIPMHLPADGDFGAALGAARLGMAASTGRAPQEIMTTPEIAEVIDPVANLVDEYAAAHASFRNSYAPVRQAQLGE